MAPKIGCASQNLLGWVQRHEVGTGVRHRVTTTEAQRVSDPECENKELRRANEIVKLVSTFSAQVELDRQLNS